MKCLLVMVIALATFVAADEEWSPIMEKKTLQKLHSDCRKESGITPEQIEKIDKPVLPDEKEVRVYTRCFGKGTGTLTDDKGYNSDRLISQFSALFENVDQIRETITGCVDSNDQKSAPDEWAHRGHKCIMDSKIGDGLRESNE